jgi:hypothetical protein
MPEDFGGLAWGIIPMLASGVNPDDDAFLSCLHFFSAIL